LTKGLHRESPVLLVRKIYNYNTLKSSPSPLVFFADVFYRLNGQRICRRYADVPVRIEVKQVFWQTDQIIIKQAHHRVGPQVGIIPILMRTGTSAYQQSVIDQLLKTMAISQLANPARILSGIIHHTM